MSWNELLDPPSSLPPLQALDTQRSQCGVLQRTLQEGEEALAAAREEAEELRQRLGDTQVGATVACAVCLGRVCQHGPVLWVCTSLPSSFWPSLRPPCSMPNNAAFLTLPLLA